MKFIDLRQYRTNVTHKLFYFSTDVTWLEDGDDFGGGADAEAGAEAGAEAVASDHVPVGLQQMPDLNDDVVDDSSVNVLRNYIKANQAPATVRRTAQISNRFEAWLKAAPRNETRPVVNLKPEMLDQLIGEWLLSLKKKNNENYEPNTVVNYHNALKRKLDDEGYPYDISTNEKFALSRKVLESKKKELKRDGKGNLKNKAECLSQDQEELLWERGAMGFENGEKLQNLIWFMFTKCFGFRGSQEARQLRWGDIQLVTNEEGAKYLMFEERITKTRNGVNTHQRAFSPKIFEADNADRCPVAAYQLFETKRPLSMMHPDAPFFLSISYQPAPHCPWYKPQPMGVDRLTQIMRRMADKAGLVGKFTNHSVRRTMCSNLIHAGIHPTVVAQLSGHKNVASLNSYACASVQQQKQMSALLQSDRNKQNIPSSVSNMPNCTVTNPAGQCPVAVRTIDAPVTSDMSDLVSPDPGQSRAGPAPPANLFGNAFSGAFVNFHGPVNFYMSTQNNPK